MPVLRQALIEKEEKRDQDEHNYSAEVIFNSSNLFLPLFYVQLE
jgi:hypothetical protein